MLTRTHPGPAARLSGAQLFEQGDLGPCELIDGEVVPMSPTGARHAFIESNLAAALRDFVTEKRRGVVLVGEVGIYVGRAPDRVRAADLAFLTAGQLAGELPAGFLETAPELVVEIVSPHDRWQDLRSKIDDYLGAGVAAVWVVEPDAESVSVHRGDGSLSRLGAQDVLRGEGSLEGFEIEVSGLLRATIP